MEFPGSWDELTAALNVANADEAWDFLLDEGLIRDNAESLEAYEAAQQFALSQIGVTGPSTGYIIASCLERAGVAPVRTIEPDPWGKRKEAAIDAWRSRRKRRLITPL